MTDAQKDIIKKLILHGFQDRHDAPCKFALRTVRMVNQTLSCLKENNLYGLTGWLQLLHDHYERWLNARTPQQRLLRVPINTSREEGFATIVRLLEIVQRITQRQRQSATVA